MAVDYATLKKGGFMRQKQKNNFSLRLRVVGGNLTAKQLAKIAEVAEKFGYDLLGRIPLDPKLTALVDRGMIELMENNYLDAARDAILKKLEQK